MNGPKEREQMNGRTIETIKINSGSKGRTGGREDGRTGGREDGRTNGRTNGRTGPDRTGTIATTLQKAKKLGGGRQKAYPHPQSANGFRSRPFHAK